MNERIRSSDLFQHPNDFLAVMHSGAMCIALYECLVTYPTFSFHPLTKGWANSPRVPEGCRRREIRCRRFANPLDICCTSNGEEVCAHPKHKGKGAALHKTAYDDAIHPFSQPMPLNSFNSPLFLSSYYNLRFCFFTLEIPFVNVFMHFCE